jgi:hypothetical protein
MRSGPPRASDDDPVASFAYGAAQLSTMGVELNGPDFATFYSPGDKGYTDYPTLGG